MSYFEIFLFITLFSNFGDCYNRSITTKEFGNLTERLIFTTTSTNVEQEGLYPLKIDPQYDEQDCWEISRVYITVYNPTSKPKLGLKYLDRPIIYAYVKYDLWQQFISDVEVRVFALPMVNCGADELDTGIWGIRNITDAGNNSISDEVVQNDDST